MDALIPTAFLFILLLCMAAAINLFVAVAVGSILWRDFASKSKLFQPRVATGLHQVAEDHNGVKQIISPDDAIAAKRQADKEFDEWLLKIPSH